MVSEFRCKNVHVHEATGATGSKHEESFGSSSPSKKLVRNCEYSKSDYFKELSILDQFLGFLQKNTLTVHAHMPEQRIRFVPVEN